MEIRSLGYDLKKRLMRCSVTLNARLLMENLHLMKSLNLMAFLLRLLCSTSPLMWVNVQTSQRLLWHWGVSLRAPMVVNSLKKHMGSRYQMTDILLQLQAIRDRETLWCRPLLQGSQVVFLLNIYRNYLLFHMMMLSEH